jgi:hypothetical protein
MVPKDREVTLSQIYSGMRGMTGLVTETSLLTLRKASGFADFPFLNFSRNYPRQWWWW